MNELKIFNSEEFGNVRTIEIEGKPYFMASDIAKALGYARPNDAVSAHCRAAVKRSTHISRANMLGRKASKLSKEYGYETAKTKDSRFGTVNTYHSDVLKEVFRDAV